MMFMTENEVKAMFEGLMTEHGEGCIFNLMMNNMAISFSYGEHEKIIAVRIRDEVLNKKNKFVRSTFLISETTKDGKKCLLNTISVDSTANKLNANQIKFSKFRNLTINRVTDKDFFHSQTAYSYFMKFQDCNNLLSMAVNIRDKNGSILMGNVELKELTELCGY